jgi:hypothetical protein
MEHYFYQEPQGNNNFRDLAKYDNMLSLIEVSWSSMIILPIHKKTCKIQILSKKIGTNQFSNIGANNLSFGSSLK